MNQWFDEGVAARRRKAKRSWNPYGPGTEAHADWNRGWDAEDAARKRKRP